MLSRLNFRGTKVSQRETLVQTAVIFEEMTIGSRRQNESVNQTLLTIRDLTNRTFLVPHVIRWSRGPKGGNNSRGYLKLTAKRTEYSTITARKPPPPACPLQGSSYLALSNQKLYKLALNRIS